MQKKVVVRIKGGLGNQLFCYAAARRLALANDAELVIDHVSGFERDFQFKREYALAPFAIRSRFASPNERRSPLAGLRRNLARLRNRHRDFSCRTYIEQRGMEYDPRLLTVRVGSSVYLDGLWQSERYFKDVAPTIRQDLAITPPSDHASRAVSESMQQGVPVAVHVRWFDAPGEDRGHNAGLDYYARAIELMESRLPGAHYYLFSDNPAAALAYLQLPPGRTSVVDHNRDPADAYKDLWLMSKCSHFICAPSTFSWWAAWLAESTDKLVVVPGYNAINALTSWGFDGMLPDDWIRV